MNNKLLVCIGGLILTVQGTTFYSIRGIQKEQQTLAETIYAERQKSAANSTAPSNPQPEYEKILNALGKTEEVLSLSLTETKGQIATRLLVLEKTITEIKTTLLQEHSSPPKINISTTPIGKRRNTLSSAEARRIEQENQSSYDAYKEQKIEKKNRKETIRLLEEQLEKEREAGLEEKRLETLGDIKRGGSSLIFDYRD